MPIPITAKGLAKFMTASHAAQRKILRDFKFPKPEGSAQAMYYSEALHCIRRYHQSGNDEDVIIRTADRLRAEAQSAGSATATRLRHNLAVLLKYWKHFGTRNFTLLDVPTLALTYGEVRVKASPDLCVREEERRLLKFDFGTKPPADQLIKAMLQIIYEAASAAGNAVTAKNVRYLDVRRGKEYPGAKTRSRLAREIEAACANIEALWPSIN